MSGGVEPSDLKWIQGPEIVREAMDLFKVDEMTARHIIDWSNHLALRKFEKWRRNYTKRFKERMKV